MVESVLQNTLRGFQDDQDLLPGFAEPFFDSLIIETDEELLSQLLRTWNEKGVSADELFALATIMRSRMKRISSIHDTFVDAVGTGGSSAKTFNVSTAAAFVIAGVGVPVAKHGNRAASSKSGSADVLTALGVRVDIEPKHAEKCLNEVGICFMFAPKFHSLSPALANARRHIAKPTIFNCLGPLCNPAGAPHQVIGVWNKELMETTAHVLARLGTKRSWVVHGEEGLDEITLGGRTFVYEVCCENVRPFELSVKDFGIDIDASEMPRPQTPDESARIIRDVLDNKCAGQPAERLVLVNAAAAIVVAGAADSVDIAYEVAQQSIRNGSATSKLKELAEATNK